MIETLNRNLTENRNINKTGGGRMRVLTAIAGVLVLAAVTATGATVEELKTKYQSDPTKEMAVTITDEMAESNDYVHSEVVEWGKSAYDQTPTAELAVKVIEEMNAGTYSTGDIITFGKNAYSQTPSGVLARETTFRIAESSLSDAVAWGKSAYADTPDTRLASRLIHYQYELGNTSDAITFGKDAFSQQQRPSIAEKVVDIIMESGQASNAVDYGLNAFQQVPDPFIGNKVIEAYSATGQYDKAVEFAKNNSEYQNERTVLVLADAMKSASDSLVADALTAMVEAKDGELDNGYLDVVDQLSDTPKQSVADTINNMVNSGDVSAEAVLTNHELQKKIGNLSTAVDVTYNFLMNNMQSLDAGQANSLAGVISSDIDETYDVQTAYDKLGILKDELFDHANSLSDGSELPADWETVVYQVGRKRGYLENKLQ